MMKYSNLRNSLLSAGLLLLCPISILPIWADSKIPLPQVKPVSFDKAEITKQETNPNNNIKAVFNDRQARLVSEIFELQADGKIIEADQKIAQLNDKIILGHILADRYLRPDYKASFAELSSWLKKYADHPQADQIYKIAVSKDTDGAKNIRKPISYQKISGNLTAISQQGEDYKSTKKRTSDQDARVQKLYREIEQNIKRQQPSLALNILSGDYAVQFMDDVEYDAQRASIAAGYLYSGELDDAKRLAQDSLSRSGASVPMAGWVKGLAEWQQGNYVSAASAFELAATSKYSSGWLVSAAAYWASRAHQRQGDADSGNKWLGLAATYPRTFYGLIAIRALGNDSHFNWKIPSLSRDDVKNIESTPQGQRAAALIQSGQLGLAEAELKNLSFDNDKIKRQSLLAYANNYNLPSLLMVLGNSFSSERGNFYDAALYPLSAWTPQDGLHIDKALLHAIIRQESRFNYDAANSSGATGLMQLMPATANHVSGKDIYDEAEGQYSLKDPEVNLALGQKYIKELLENKAVQKDLMALAIAYNAGPGNFSKWKAERAQIKDPLLFIETIPYPETRAFVERVMSNYWIYKMRFDEKTPSLDALAEGKWELYMASINAQRVASR